MQDVIIRLLVKFLGQYVTPELVAQLKQEAVCWLVGQVANTANRIDDQVVEILAEALEVDVTKCPAPAA